ncbi:hypothetical protein KI387_035486, partial [Taxus chinensis]
ASHNGNTQNLQENPTNCESNGGGSPPKQFLGLPASEVIRQDIEQKSWYEDPNFTGFITVYGMEKAEQRLGRKVAEERAAAASQRSKCVQITANIAHGNYGNFLNTEKTAREEFPYPPAMAGAPDSTNAVHLEEYFDSGGLTNKTQLNYPLNEKSNNFPSTPGFSGSGSPNGFGGIGVQYRYDSSIEECIEMTKKIKDYYELVRYPDLQLEVAGIKELLSKMGNDVPIIIPEVFFNEEEFSKKCFELWENDHLKADGSKPDMSTQTLKMAVEECSFEVKARYCRDPAVSEMLRSWYRDFGPTEEADSEIFKALREETGKSNIKGSSVKRDMIKTKQELAMNQSRRKPGRPPKTPNSNTKEHLTISPHSDPVEELLCPSKVETTKEESTNPLEKEPHNSNPLILAGTIQDSSTKGGIFESTIDCTPFVKSQIPIETLEVILPISAEGSNED